MRDGRVISRVYVHRDRHTDNETVRGSDVVNDVHNLPFFVTSLRLSWGSDINLIRNTYKTDISKTISKKFFAKKSFAKLMKKCWRNTACRLDKCAVYSLFDNRSKTCTVQILKILNFCPIQIYKIFKLCPDIT